MRLGKKLVLAQSLVPRSRDGVWERGYTFSAKLGVASFLGSPEREINTRGEPGIFSHVIKI